MLLFFYIVKELVFPLLLSTGVISTILMMNQIFEFIPFLQSTGIEFEAIFLMILYSLPQVLMISVPISLMIGIYSGISRLSSDSELIVMRASGVSLTYFFKPVLFLSFFVSIFVMVQTFYLSPIGVRKLDELKYNILKKQTRLNLTVQQINNFFGQKLIYLFDKKDDVFEGIFIADWTATPGSGVIEAQSGKIYLDDKIHKIVFKLANGSIHNLIDENSYRIIKFDKLDYDFAPPAVKNANLPQRFRKYDGTTYQRLDTELTIFELVHEINTTSEKEQTHFEYLEELHNRIVTILSCVCFAIFSLPMGVYNPRDPKTGNIVYMVLVLVIYFFLYAHARTLVSRGSTTPAVLYVSLFFVVGNGLVKYYKNNKNIDSISSFLLNRFQIKVKP